MNSYLNATVMEMLERIKVLKTKMPNDAPDCFHQLIAHCTNDIDEKIIILEEFISDPKYQVPQNLARKMIDFQDVVKYIDYLENQIIAPIHRWDNDDVKFTKLIQKICKEIGFPLIPPVASRLTTKYYWIDTKFNHIHVPLLESEFLLHLPDLYHELAHRLIAVNNDPRVFRYQERYSRFMDYIDDYFRNEIISWRKNGGDYEANALYTFYRSWKNWAIELFCDLFAVFTLGISYAWANLHLCIKIGSNPYYTPSYSISTHPADAVRMQAIFKGLEVLGLDKGANEVQKYWKQYLHLSNQSVDQKYKMAYPEILVEKCVSEVYEATKGINCKMYDVKSNNEVGKLIETAWKKFIDNPSGYLEWERGKREAIDLDNNF